jgi:hypothetical protein
MSRIQGWQKRETRVWRNWKLWCFHDFWAFKSSRVKIKTAFKCQFCPETPISGISHSVTLYFRRCFPFTRVAAYFMPYLPTLTVSVTFCHICQPWRCRLLFHVPANPDGVSYYLPYLPTLTVSVTFCHICQPWRCRLLFAVSANPEWFHPAAETGKQQKKLISISISVTLKENFFILNPF